MEYQQRIVCAANRNKNGNMLIGPRHWDHTMRVNYHVWFCQLDLEEKINKKLIDFSEEGFIDQHGVFMSRTEAWKVASAAGQITRRVGGDSTNGGTLYSENLY